MGEPKYRLEGIVHTRSDAMEDFEALEDGRGINWNENGSLLI